MSKAAFFDRCLERDPDLALTAIKSMPADFRVTFYTNETLLEIAKQQLLESASTDRQRELILTLNEIFTWHNTMLSNSMFVHGAALMEKEMARKIWRFRDS